MVYYRYFEYGEDGNPIQKDYNPKISRTGRLEYIHSVVRKIVIRCRPNSSIDEDRPTHDTDPVQATENQGANQQSEETVARDFFEYIGYYSHLEPVDSSNPPRFERKGIFCESFFSPIHDIGLPEDGDLLRLLNEARTGNNAIGSNQGNCGQPGNNSSGCHNSANSVPEETTLGTQNRCRPPNPMPVPAVTPGTGAQPILGAGRGPRTMYGYPGGIVGRPYPYAGNTDFQLSDRLRRNRRQWQLQQDLLHRNYGVFGQPEFSSPESASSPQTPGDMMQANRPFGSGSVSRQPRHYSLPYPGYERDPWDLDYFAILARAELEYWSALLQEDFSAFF